MFKLLSALCALYCNIQAARKNMQVLLRLTWSCSDAAEQM